MRQVLFVKDTIFIRQNLFLAFIFRINYGELHNTFCLIHITCSVKNYFYLQLNSIASNFKTLRDPATDEN